MENIKDLVAEYEKANERIHVLVNNAGVLVITYNYANNYLYVMTKYVWIGYVIGVLFWRYYRIYLLLSLLLLLLLLTYSAIIINNNNNNNNSNNNKY